MKTIKNILAILAISLTSLSFAQDVKTIKFEADGVCGMCKERIETALDIKGVKKATWDVETHLCEVTYQPSKVSEKEIHAAINAVGHDTEKSKAKDEVYNKIHPCCRYRSGEVQKAHKDEEK